MKKKETTPKLDRSLISFRSLGREQRRLFGLYALGLCLVFLLAALIAFFAILKGPEKVMVPDLRGMELADALVRMHERELYPRLSLRFTNNPQDKNTILEQDPLPGVIVKAGRRIKLTVSRGAVLDEIDNYIGKNIDAVKLELLSLFSSTQALVSIREPPVYRFDDAEPGTILEQSPPAGEQISGPTVLELVVSKGPESAKKKVPVYLGLSMAEAIAQMEKSSFTVDFSMRQPKQGEKPGIVVEQQPKAGVTAQVKDRIQLVLSAPEASPGLVHGVFMYTLPEYPYPVPVKIEALKSGGQRQLIASMKHPGGGLSIPFSLPEGSTLILSALDKEISRTGVKR
ncbi:MAG TPA: penicillin-binding protein [Spirochaetaceae bacterium]|nr:penicillin-binding protein [Spirochaetaceae bacterium]